MLKSRQSKSPSPTKGKKEPEHWSQRVVETIVSAGSDGMLHLVVKGGAENGQFAFIGDIKQDKINYHSGKFHQDSVVLEVQGQKVAGFTLRDLLDWMKYVGKNNTPIMFKTVKSGLYYFFFSCFELSLSCQLYIGVAIGIVHSLGIEPCSASSASSVCRTLQHMGQAHHQMFYIILLKTACRLRLFFEQSTYHFVCRKAGADR